MRVLVTVPDLHPDSGGPSLSALRSAESLAERGVTTALAYGAPEGAAPVASREPRLTLLPVADTGKALLGARAYHKRLLATARAFAPDLIYDFGVWLPKNFASAAVARKLGVSWITSPRGMLEPWPRSSKKLKKQIAWTLYQGRALRGAAGLVATSTDELDNLHKLLPQARLFLVPNGVDLPDNMPAGERPRQALYLSRLDPKKQPDLLIRAWAEIRPAGWKLVIAGPGAPEYRESLQNLIAQLGVADTVDLRREAYGADKEALLGGSQLFLLPTLSENFGIAIAEALAWGLPVVTTTATPWAGIEPAGCGWVTAPDMVNFSTAMRRALGLDAGTLARMGETGRQFAARYSWARTGELLHAACTDVLASGQVRRA